jgi:hypothetical protein
VLETWNKNCSSSSIICSESNDNVSGSNNNSCYKITVSCTSSN